MAAQSAGGIVDLPHGRPAGRADSGALAADSTATLDVRVSTFPTLYGEKAVVRLFTSEAQLLRLEDLGFPADIAARLSALLNEAAGDCHHRSGRERKDHDGLRLPARADRTAWRCGNLVTIEDPIEVGARGSRTDAGQ